MMALMVQRRAEGVQAHPGVRGAPAAARRGGLSGTASAQTGGPCVRSANTAAPGDRVRLGWASAALLPRPAVDPSPAAPPAAPAAPRCSRACRPAHPQWRRVPKVAQRLQAGGGGRCRRVRPLLAARPSALHSPPAWGQPWPPAGALPPSSHAAISTALFN